MESESKIGRESTRAKLRRLEMSNSPTKIAQDDPEDPTKPKFCSWKKMKGILAWRPWKHMHDHNPCPCCYKNNPSFHFQATVAWVVRVRILIYYLIAVFMAGVTGWVTIARRDDNHYFNRISFYLATILESIVYIAIYWVYVSGVTKRNYYRIMLWAKISPVGVAIAIAKMIVLGDRTPEYIAWNILYFLATTAFYLYELWIWMAYKVEHEHGLEADLGSISWDDRDNTMKANNAFVPPIAMRDPWYGVIWRNPETEGPNTSYARAEHFLFQSSRFLRPQKPDIPFQQLPFKDRVTKMRFGRSHIKAATSVPRMARKHHTHAKPHRSLMALKEEQFRESVDTYLDLVKYRDTDRLMRDGKENLQRKGQPAPKWPTEEFKKYEHTFTILPPRSVLNNVAPLTESQISLVNSHRRRSPNQSSSASSMPSAPSLKGMLKKPGFVTKPLGTPSTGTRVTFNESTTVKEFQVPRRVRSLRSIGVKKFHRPRFKKR